MARYRIPDHLICLGGAGQEIGETFMTQRWILEEILKDNPRDDAPDQGDANRDKKAFFIDTDEKSIDDDFEDRVDAIVEDIIDEHELNAPDRPTVETINIVEKTNPNLLTADELLAPARVNEIAEDRNLNSWWLRRSDDPDSGDKMLDPLGDFTGGVVRRRGLTKAISKASEFDADPLQRIEASLSSQNNPQTAMVVGLGGGTGSGLFIDLAYRLRNQTDASITLFGVLPTPSGGDDITELANAYAALSEIEYLAINGRNLFQNVILLPLEPATDYDAFDAAATYAIASYYNIRDDQANVYARFDESEDPGPPKFAPFTMAIPRYLHYLKEDIDETETNFKDFLEQKEAAQEVEEEMFDYLKDFIIEADYEEAAGELITADETNTVNIRLESSEAINLRNDQLKPLRTLLEQDFMEEIEFWSAGEIGETIDDIEDASHEKVDPQDEDDRAAATARDMFDRLASGIDGYSQFEPEGGWVSNERDFAEIVVDEIQLIARRAGFRRAANRIEGEDPKVARDIRRAIDPEQAGHVAEVEEEIEQIATHIEELNEDIAAIELVIQAGRNEAAELEEEWEESVEANLREYHTLVEKENRIEGLIADLRGELMDLKGDAEVANSHRNIAVRKPNFDDFTELNRALEEVSLDPIDEEAVNRSAKKMLQARKQHLRAQEIQGTLLERIRNLIGWGTAVGNLYDEYIHIQNHQIDSKILTISDWDEPFDVEIDETYFDGRLHELESRREQLLARILESTDEQIEVARQYKHNPTRLINDEEDSTSTRLGALLSETPEDEAESYREQLEQTLQSGDWNMSSHRELVRDLRRETVGDLLEAILVDPFVSLKNEKKSEKSTLEFRHNRYQELEDIVTDTGLTFHNLMEKVMAIDEISEFEEPDETGAFRDEMLPKDRGKIGNSQDLGDTPLWDETEPEERERIEQELKNLATEAGIHSDYLPLREHQIQSWDTERVTYEGLRARTVFMSRLFNGYSAEPSAHVERVRDAITSQAPFNEGTTYRATRGTFAGPWDLAMTTFVGGVFLDNLRLFTDECRNAYVDQAVIKENAKDKFNHQSVVPDTVMRHTYGIDGTMYHKEDQFFPDESDGAFCYRSDVIDVGDDEDLKKLLDHAEDEHENSEEAARLLRDEFYQSVGFPSTIDLDQ